MAFEGLSEKLEATFKKLRGKGKVRESDIKEAMREVRLAMLEADVNYKVVKDFIATTTERCQGAEVLESLTPAQQIIKIVNEELTALMGSENSEIRFSSKPPTVIMMCGLQGSGKTTHSAKLARHFKSMGKRPLLVACDIYRPAAIDQLKVVGKQVDVPVFEMGTENPVKIAEKSIRHALDYGNDIVILDTAGRLHIDEELMDELKKIKNKVDPDEILLVVDAMTGQDAVNVAESFDNHLGIDGVIITKMDGDTRGGAALSIRAVTGKPIKFIGMGEKLDALEPFHPSRMASRILGMGDVLTLIEKAEAEIDLEEAEKLAEKLEKNKFDLNDLLDQMKQVRKMGSFASILSMLPGGNKISDEEAAEGDRQLKRMESIMNSMTPLERSRPEVFNAKRKRRVAAGSGTQVEDVNRLLNQYKQIQKMMKSMTGGKRMNPKMKKAMQQFEQMENGGIGGIGGMGGGFPF